MRPKIREVILLTILLTGGLSLIGAEAASSPPRQVLRFPNGDRLSGELVKETETHFIFKNATIGEVTVPKTSVTIASEPSREFQNPPVESLVGITPIQDSRDQTPPAKAKPTGKPSPKSDSSSAEKLPQTLDAPKNETWNGKIEFGLRQQQGRRDLLTFDLRGSAEKEMGDDSLRAKARLLYGEQDGRINNDRYDGSFQWRRQIGERTFAQSLSSYFQDDLKDIKRNWEQNLGAGYRLYKKEGHVVNLGAGLTGQYREATRAESGFYALAEIFQDYTYRINKRMTVRQDMRYQYSPDGGTRFLTVKNQPASTLEEAINYKVRFNSVLQGRLTQKLSLNLRFEFEYDNAVSDKSARTDQRITSSLGYAF